MSTKKGIKPINKGGGKWLIRVSCGYDGQGKKVMKSEQIQLDPHKSEAKQYEEACLRRDRLRLQYEDGLLSGKKDVTLSAYVEQWKESYCRRKRLAESTIAGYQNLLDTRILPQMGKLKLRDIKPATLNRFINAMSKENLSGTYQRKYFNLLHLILRTAVREQLITVNPVDGIEPPQKDTQERPCYDAQQSAQLVRALEDAPAKWRAFVLLLLGSGMRCGEAVGLDWRCVDFEKKEIRIEQACGYAKGTGQYIKEPKTKSGKRTIKIDGNTLEALRLWKREQAQQKLKLAAIWQDEGAVFTQDDGKRMNIHAPTHWFKKFLKAHDLPALNLHGLRHTSASLLLANGAPMTDVSHRLGHSRVSTTMDIYSHAYEEGNARLADQIASLVYEKNG